MFFLNKWIERWSSIKFYFDQDSGWSPVGKTEKSHKDKAVPAVRCAYCQYVITDKEQAIKVDGQHCHVFTNPDGITFEIAMYRKAECVQHGFATTVHTWFSGCAWQVSLCGNCKSHLGWRYTRADSDGFFGLITEHIIEM